MPPFLNLRHDQHLSKGVLRIAKSGKNQSALLSTRGQSCSSTSCSQGLFSGSSCCDQARDLKEQNSLHSFLFFLFFWEAVPQPLLELYKPQNLVCSANAAEAHAKYLSLSPILPWRPGFVPRRSERWSPADTQDEGCTQSSGCAARPCPGPGPQGKSRRLECRSPALVMFSQQVARGAVSPAL